MIAHVMMTSTSASSRLYIYMIYPVYMIMILSNTELDSQDYNLGTDSNMEQETR